MPKKSPRRRTEKSKQKSARGERIQNFFGFVSPLPPSVSLSPSLSHTNRDQCGEESSCIAGTTEKGINMTAFEALDPS